MGDIERPPRLGDWICPEHGTVTPYTGGVVAACPECLEPALHTVHNARGDQVYRMPAPDYCGGPDRHPLTAGRVLIGWKPCRCQGGGGHTTWSCRACPSVLMWPPHDLAGPPTGGGWRL
ncbi:hypothetical protein K1W54_28810 [Micromonospora sp. CPCC 205371]|nr:hypothetical protein [Micromonospora sp. CPCC 205371]